MSQDNTLDSSLVDHLESTLGRITSRWNAPQAAPGIDIGVFWNVPEPGLVILCTIGMSRGALKMTETKDIRQEMLLILSEPALEKDAAAFLLSFASNLVKKGEALLRGDTAGPGSPLVENRPMNGVYATLPVMFPDAFEVYYGSEPPTVFTWLVPLHAREIDFIEENGYPDFEDLFDTDDDLFSFSRPPLV